MTRETTSRKRGGLMSSWSPEPLLRLREEMEDLLSRFWGQEGAGPIAGLVTPPLDLSETDDSLQVRIDLPGVNPDNIDIVLSGNRMTISGQRPEEKEEPGRVFHRVERRSGSFSRSITLPCDVQEEQIEAQEHEGVVTITMPKAETSRARKIKVQRARQRAGQEPDVHS